MPNPKLTCIDMTHDVPIKKEELLKLIKDELDKEFATDVVAAHSRITVTLDAQSASVPRPGKK